jgi:hypothetical protein
MKLRAFGFQPNDSVMLATRTRALAAVYKTVVVSERFFPKGEEPHSFITNQNVARFLLSKRAQ